MLSAIPPRLLRHAFPGRVIPGAARRDVSQAHIPFVVGGRLLKRFPQLHELWVQTQLQDRADPPACLSFQRLQLIQVPRIDDQWLLADHVRAHPERQAAMRIMQIVRRANAHIMHTLFFRPSSQLFQVPVEAFDLGEKPCAEPVLIEDAD